MYLENVDRLAIILIYSLSLSLTSTRPPPSEVEVLYGGPNLFDYEVKHSSIHDIILAIISLVLVLFLAYFMSGFSFWLTVVALYTITSSFPIAFFVYTKILGE